jgi:HD superfamily phosphohydrolase
MLGQADVAIKTGWQVLADFGLGAFFAISLLGSLLVAAYWAITVYLPKIEAERKETRESFLAALASQQKGFENSLSTIEARWGQTTQAICDRLDRLTTRVDVLDARRHPQQAAEPWAKRQHKEDGE